MVVAERRKFLRRDQVPGESTTDYVVQLKKLSLHCSYGDKLDENLRDRFISGLRDEPTALKLMEKVGEQDNLSFNKAVEFALARESTAESTKAMRGAGDTTSAAVSTNVNTLKRSQRKQPRSRKQCYRCGRNHPPEDCWFKSTECRRCRKIGHIEIMCRSEEPKAENKKRCQYGKKKNYQRKSGKRNPKSHQRR
ncbi:hypothetical protein HOLleu_40846 [Holothuria leucospilota]|uniref:Uncharacterized protein n=1 Tax=Holothuria leucospilota TaxID=206669 RepID=A0A9Q1BBZ0_HOLLE|nr:hypothetical protein HOLleu_40846 [Holothuria leucospilota]